MEKFNIKNLKEYHVKDQELYKLEQAYANSDEVKRFRILEAEVKNSRAQSDALSKEAEEIIAALKAKGVEINRAIESNGAIPSTYDSFDELEDLNCEKNILETLAALLDKTEREINNQRRRLDDVLNESKIVGAKLSDSLKKALIASEQRKQKQLEIQKEAMPIKKELDSAAKTLDSVAFTHYNAVRKNKGLPVMVEMVGDSCSGCGMDIRIEMQDLKNGEAAECPFCGRIVYKA